MARTNRQGGVMKRKILWYLINGFVAFCLYKVMVDNQQWCKNIVLFTCWFSSIIWLVTVFVEDSARAIYEKGRPVPVWLSVPFDIVLSFFLIANGWFFLSVFYILGSSFEYAIFEGITKFNGVMLKDEPIDKEGL
jgi:hypothetical protein